MKVLRALISALAAAPISAVFTVLLSPFWRWAELRTGMEFLGHSGPSGWCYLSVYIVLVFILFAAYLFCAKRAGRTKTFD
jgi:hypothetical protein